MCETCRNKMREVITALIIDDEDNEIVRETSEMVERSLPRLVKKVRQYAREHDFDPPSKDEIRSNLHDSLVAAEIGLVAAVMASRCEGFIDEGGLPPSIVLGMWAGEVMHSESRIENSNLARHLLGMGDN